MAGLGAEAEYSGSAPVAELAIDCEGGAELVAALVVSVFVRLVSVLP